MTLANIFINWKTLSTQIKKTFSTRRRLTFVNNFINFINQGVFDLVERPGEDEPNCSTVMIGADMKPEDVATMVLEKIGLKEEDSHL